MAHPLRSKLQIQALVKSMSNYLKIIAERVDTMSDEELDRLEAALNAMTKSVYYRI